MLSWEKKSTPESAEKFRYLQAQLRDRWQNSDVFDREDCDILIVPSFSIDQKVGSKIPGFLHYEERLLFSLIRLRNPKTRLIYVTAQPLCPIIVDYYLQLLPGIPFSHARDRLLLISTYDNSFKPLTQKILERPRLLERIRRALRPQKSYLVCYNSTWLEYQLSLELDIPLLAPSPELLYWGFKSGSREIFAECNISHPDGSLQVNTVEELVTAAAQLWQRQPQLLRMVVKLNEGFSGEGNAILDLRPIQEFAPSSGNFNDCVAALHQQLKQMSFQAKGETWSNFSSRIPELGAIVEAFIEGDIKRSPSVQGYIDPKGEISILSTHDQILGGADGQIYHGCYFPADADYRLELQELGIKVGKVLAAKGAIERFGVDFIATPQPNNPQKWDLEAIEINLRKGGTTHPFMTLKFLTNGRYNYNDGLFYSQEGQPKYYVASDNLQKPQYQGLLPNDLMDIIAKHRLHFDSNSQTGTIFHLMGSLSEFGKIGLTSISNSPEQALKIYQQVEAALDEETKAILEAKDDLASSNVPMSWDTSNLESNSDRV
jgi:PGM1 C-terminal domain